MKGSVSPAVAVVVIIVVLAIVGVLGMKLLGGSKGSDNVDPAMKAQYMGQMNPEAQKAEAMKHMQNPPPAPSGGGR